MRRRLRQVERLLGDRALSADCIVSTERQSVLCELLVHVRGTPTLRGIGRHARLTTAASLAAAKVWRQAQRLTDRWKTRRHDGGARAVSAAERERVPPSDKAGPRVIRARPRETKPMTVADAALLLSESDQPVLVFRRAAGEGLAILYKRRDGHFGFIDPEV
jgi:ribosome-associated translation inhibitor RaiA